MEYPSSEQIAELEDSVSENESPATEEPVAPEEGQAADQGQQEASTEEAATQPAPEWNGTEYALNFRGKQIVPENKDKLINWAQLGYSYDKRAAGLKEREEALKAQEQQIQQYKQLSEAFEKNPMFQKQIMDLYHQSQLQQGQQQPGQQQGQQVPPEQMQYLQPILQQQQQLQQKLQQYEAYQADQQLQQEIDTLASKYADQEWGVPNEDGVTLEQEVLQHSHKLGGVPLETAYRDLMFEHMKTQTSAETLKKQAEQKQAQTRQGVVGTSAAPPKAQPRSLDYGNMSYDEIARSVISNGFK